MANTNDTSNKRFSRRLLSGKGRGLGKGPRITSISPSTGSVRGHFLVTLKGEWFTSDSTVTIGDVQVLALQVVDENTIVCTIPPYQNGLLVKDIAVSNHLGNTLLAAGFSYIKDKLPPQGKASYLVDETVSMDRQRRLEEQAGHRQLAKVNARAHSDEVQVTREGELQNSILQHPLLDGQRYDGIDPNLNPEPPLNTEARREFDNERREQEMEKQLRLGNMPKFSSTPKPPGM